MGKRDILKIADKFKGQHLNNPYLSAYDLSLDEFCLLLEMACKDPAKAISTAFDAGFILGGRAREKKRIPVL